MGLKKYDYKYCFKTIDFKGFLNNEILQFFKLFKTFLKPVPWAYPNGSNLFHSFTKISSIIVLTFAHDQICS